MRTTLHLVRAGATPSHVADHDWVVYLQPTRLAHGGSPDSPRRAPLPTGPIEHDQVVALAFAADLVLTW